MSESDASLVKDEELTELAIVPGDVMARFLMVHRYLSRYARRIMEDFGISGRTLAALRYLARIDRATIGELSQHLYIRNSSASEMVTKIERLGLVKRVRCSEDNRVVRVSLTDEGKRIVAGAPLGGFGLLRERLAGLDDGELQVLSKCMDRLAELLDLNPETGNPK